MTRLPGEWTDYPALITRITEMAARSCHVSDLVREINKFGLVAPSPVDLLEQLNEVINAWVAPTLEPLTELQTAEVMEKLPYIGEVIEDWAKRTGNDKFYPAPAPSDPDFGATSSHDLDLDEDGQEGYYEGTDKRLYATRLRLARQNVEMTGDRRFLTDERNRLAKQQNALYDWAKSAQKPLELPKMTPPIVMKRADLDLVLQVTDGHLGKMVRPQDNAEGYEYNKDLYLQYLQVIQENVYDTLRLLGGGVRNLHVIMTGDNNDGSDMRPGHPYRVDLSFGEQIDMGGRSYAGLISSCHGMGFKRTSVIGLTGNHSRSRQHLDDNRIADRSEYSMLRYMEALLERESGIDVDVPLTEYAAFQIQNSRYYAEHWHRVKGSGGETPVAGIKKRIRYLRESMEIDADVYVGGHFHQTIIHDAGNGRRIVCGASFDGGDDFTCQALGKAAGSSQLLWLQDNTGIRMIREIQLRDPRTRGVTFKEVA